METTIKSLVTKTDLLSLKSDLSKEIGKLKSSIFKLMLVLWIVNITILLVVAYFKTK